MHEEAGFKGSRMQALHVDKWMDELLTNQSHVYNGVFSSMTVMESKVSRKKRIVVALA